MDLATSFVLTILSAIAYGVCFAPIAARWLAWGALVPFLVALRGKRLRTVLALAWIWTIATSQIIADFLPWAVANYYQQPIALGIAFAVGAETLQAGLQYMVFAAYVWALGPTPSWRKPLLVGAAWTAAEAGRIHLFWGNPLGVLGYSQTANLPLIQIADITGVYGVSFTLAAANAAVFELYLAARRRQPWRPALTGAGLVTGVVALVLGYGAAKMHGSLATLSPGEVKIAIVQGNLDLGSQWRQEFYGTNLDTYLQLTKAAVRSGAQLVFWPENTLTFFLDDEPSYRRLIAGVLDPDRAELVVGGPRFEGMRSPRYYNSVFLVGSGGNILARYDKQRLLPLAEYFPFPSLDLMRRHFGRIREFTAGVPTTPLPTLAGGAGVLVCNEAMFAEDAAARVGAGAEYLVNLANDTWLNDRQWGALVFDIVALRAVEQRRHLVRTSTSGPSAIIDPLGRVTAYGGPSLQTTVAGTLGRSAVVTVYYRVGDLFAWLCVAFAAGGLGATWWRRRAQ